MYEPGEDCTGKERENKMKPSERIVEIRRKKYSQNEIGYMQALIDYLDEEYEKQCQHAFVFMTENGIDTVERCCYCDVVIVGRRKNNGPA